MRPERRDIALPEFPPGTEWINVASLPARTLLGQGVALVWFWDYCSLNALRALPYLEEWHRRYGDRGLKVIGVHSPQFPFAREQGLVQEAVRRLGIEFPVAPDPDYEVWRLYGNEVWPAIYLWDRTGVLRFYHFGEGEYDQAEGAIQELLREIDADAPLPEPMAPVRRTDHPGALVQMPTPHRYLEQDRSGRRMAAGESLSISYQGATAAAVLEGTGKLDVLVDSERRRTLHLDGARLYKLVESGRHEKHDLELRFRDDALAYAFSFAPGPALDG
jgi:thioredoxin family protein/AhpC/TSA family protein